MQPEVPHIETTEIPIPGSNQVLKWSDKLYAAMQERGQQFEAAIKNMQEQQAADKQKSIKLLIKMATANQLKPEVQQTMGKFSKNIERILRSATQQDFALIAKDNPRLFALIVGLREPARFTAILREYEVKDSSLLQRFATNRLTELGLIAEGSLIL